jgi:tRNA(fMet)-specific endonuclease VapC
MEDNIVLADTSILIDYFRKTEKSNSTLVKLFHQGYNFCISAITEYEIYSDATGSQIAYWDEILKWTHVFGF